jgi:Bacterial PH domain
LSQLDALEEFTMQKYNETYVQLVSRGLMDPGEQLLGATACKKKPLIPLGPWFVHHILVLATNRRLILVDHRQGLIYSRIDNVQSIPWDQVQDVRIGGLFGKKVVLNAAGKKQALALPRFFGPIGNNVKAAQGVAEQFNFIKQAGHRQLPAQAPYGALPA